MIVAFVLVAASLPSTVLPPLPDRGLARETTRGVQLQTLHGRPIATMPGLHLAMDKKVGDHLVLRDGHGRLFILDVRAHLVRGYSPYAQQPAGCRETDTLLFVCGRTIRDGSRVVARAPRGSPVGHWVWAERAPHGSALLAQWSAECEVPVAYKIADGRLEPYGTESSALGFMPDGSALIHCPNGPCGGGPIQLRGIYAVPPHARARLVLRTPRFAQYGMWGG